MSKNLSIFLLALGGIGPLIVYHVTTIGRNRDRFNENCLSNLHKVVGKI